MLVLFEGVDNSGKSSLLKELTVKFPGVIQLKNPYKPTIHKPDFLAGVYAGIYYSLHRHSANQQSLYFLDRSHITEIVYGKVMRAYNAYQFFDWKKYEKAMRFLTIVIYMSAPLSLLQQRWREEKEEYIPFDKIKEIVKAYEKYLKTSSLNHLGLSSADSMDDNLLKVINFLGKRTQHEYS